MLVRIMKSWDGSDVPPDADGFVHLSWPEQVPGTIQRHYADAPSLVFLVVDENALASATVRVEDTTGHGSYPHLYATLPPAAVVRGKPWRPGWELPHWETLLAEVRPAGSLGGLSDQELAAVVKIVRALAEEDLAVLREAGANDEIYLGTRNYELWDQVHLVVPPGAARSWRGGVSRRDDSSVHVEVDMWTQEEGESDLTLQLELERDGTGGVRALVQDLHVQ